MAGNRPSALLHQVGVSFGDHAETVVKAVEVFEDETVGALLERLMPLRYGHRNYDNFVVLRLVEPAEPESDLPDVPTTAPF